MYNTRLSRLYDISLFSWRSVFISAQAHILHGSQVCMHAHAYCQKALFHHWFMSRLMHVCEHKFTDTHITGAQAKLPYGENKPPEHCRCTCTQCQRFVCSGGWTLSQNVNHARVPPRVWVCQANLYTTSSRTRIQCAITACLHVCTSVFPLWSETIALHMPCK